MGRTHRIAEPVRPRPGMLPGIVAQEVELMIGKHQPRFAVGHLPAEQRHDHDAPGNHSIDRNRPLQPFGSAEQQKLDPAAGLQEAEIVFNSPALQVIADHLGGLPGRADLKRRQQVPLDRVLARRWCGLFDMNRRQGYRFATRHGRGRRQCHTTIAELAAGQPLEAGGPRLLAA